MLVSLRETVASIAKILRIVEVNREGMLINPPLDCIHYVLGCPNKRDQRLCDRAHATFEHIYLNSKVSMTVKTSPSSLRDMSSKI